MNIEKLIRQMTLEEKAGLLSGADFWHLKGVDRLGVPSVMVTDGPHGLRKQPEGEDHLGINDSVEAVAFPTAAGLACSFDRALLSTLGDALGEECQAEKVAVILGPGANIKRSPLCGRNFEYFSEDPYLSGEIAAAHIRGIQSRGVGTSLKHFALNNQEHRRMTTNVLCDERALREIYLASFERAVKQGNPWTVMCSYNKIDGVYASENSWLLRDVLRGEWGFEGCTVTDWGACAEHVDGVRAGMDLQMPGAGHWTDDLIVEAVKVGALDEAVVDEAVGRVLALIYRAQEHRDPSAVFDRMQHHHLARRIARETLVLLKNEEGLLPLKASRKIAFIGKFAKQPRYQGSGSSHIHPSEVLSALDAVRSVTCVNYAQGYDDWVDEIDEGLINEAVETARAADVAVLFVGLPEAFESEGFDRAHMRLPDCQNALIEAVAAVNPNVAVVLHNGSPVEMPWADSVQAILEAYLGGQAVGGAVVDVLFGAVNPCGKLAETIPMRLEDNPSYLSFPGDGDEVRYAEGIYVGYRWYDARKLPVRFPFGHGLSYTTFEYSNLRLSSETLAQGGTLAVCVDVSNTGKVAGKEIVQLYVSCAHEGVARPPKELCGFEKVALEPGETKAVAFTLSPRALSYWEKRIGDWYAEGGAYQIHVAASSRDIRLTAEVELEAPAPLPVRVTADTTCGDILRIPGGREVIAPLLDGFSRMLGGGDESIARMAEAMAKYTPLHGFRSFVPGRFTTETLNRLIEALNQMQETRAPDAQDK